MAKRAKLRSKSAALAFCVGLVVSSFVPMALQPVAAKAATSLPGSLVFLKDIDPTILEDIRYSTEDNFTAAPVSGYTAAECILDRDAAQALSRVQRHLRPRSLSLKVYDCYRPLHSANALVDWAEGKPPTPGAKRFFPSLMKDQLEPLGYITRSGSHSRGIAIDLTLVTAPPEPVAQFDPRKQYGPRNGIQAERSPDNSVDMGTGFDCFDLKSHTHNEAITTNQRHWRQILLDAMRAEGFDNFDGEWWHFKFAAGDNRPTYDVDVSAHGTASSELWNSLPSPAGMPAGGQTGYASSNGAKIFFSVYGSGPPAILLHGGLANGNFWGNQIGPLATNHRVVVIDSRGHGRSTRDDRPFTYDLLASDVLAVMDTLKLERAAIVGWSDGAIVGLQLAIDHPTRVDRLFAFAANANPRDLRSGVNSPVFALYRERAEDEYRRLSRTPRDFEKLSLALHKMWVAQPNFTPSELARIHIATAIVDGDHDEIIRRNGTEYLAHNIAGARLIILPGVSHFAMLQNPTDFNSTLLSFLDQP